MAKKTIELLEPKTSMVTEDWENRQMTVAIVDSIEKMVKILDKFELKCRTKLKILSEKIEFAEKKVDYLESLFDLEKEQQPANDEKNTENVIPPPALDSDSEMLDMST